jgi:hypothetical protein
MTARALAGLNWFRRTASAESSDSELEQARTRLRTYRSSLSRMTPEQRAELFSSDDPEISGNVAKRTK